MQYYARATAVLLAALSTGTAFTQTYVRVRDGQIETRPTPDGRPRVPQFRSLPQTEMRPEAAVCSLATRASYGQSLPDGGSLYLIAFADPATIVASGRTAFYSRVTNSLRNQGIFFADATGPRTIVRGCGGGGGSGNPGSCGDPSPIGGTFAGLFGGTPFAPASNDAGDVLFVADILGGGSPRGLFLYHDTSHQFVKVAAVGDAAPGGGTFVEVGPGSLDNSGRVAFLATRSGSTYADVFLWKNGSVQKVAMVGDPAPGGGTFSYLGTERFGFQDGTYIPTGPIPDINDNGQIAFRAYVSGGPFPGGLLVSENGVHQWSVRAGDPTPMGGTYADFFAPLINNAGEMAFFGDVQLPGEVSSGWFAGSEGHWRKALAFNDPLDGGEVHGLAISRGPMRPLDEAGDLLLWCDLSSDGGVERYVISTKEGNTFVVARTGDSVPTGGQLGTMDAWPSMAGCLATLGASTPGGGSLNAHMVFEKNSTEVSELRVSKDASVPGLIALSWESQRVRTCSLGDVARGHLGILRSSGYTGDVSCVASNLGDTPYQESGGLCATSSGDGCWYLVRAQNSCGVATWGPPALDASSPCP
jgi:hypothetical protein